MNVLHVHKVKGIGGSERHLLTLLPALAENGVGVTLLVLGSDDVDRFMAAAAHAGVDAHLVPAGRDVDPRTFARIRRTIGAVGPDLVHTHLIHADVYGQMAARSKRIPSVSSIHSVHRFYGRQPVRSAARMAGRIARRTIAISEHVAENIAALRLAPPERVRVVPYGVDVLPFADEQQVGSARRSFGVDGFVVGIASNLIPGKGHDIALEAFSHMDGSGSRLLIAGDGPLRAELERMSDRLGLAERARFLGYVEDMPAFLAACDVVVFPTLPSLGEGFGLAALEGMGAARPVIASRLGPLGEIVEDGVSGFLFTPGDAGALSAALTKLQLDPDLRGAMGRAARERAATSFSVNAMTEGTLNVYREVIS